MFLTEDEFEKIKNDERLIILGAALDSQCFFLTPNCNKCTHAVYKSGSKCMYNLKTEMCYKHEGCPDFNDDKLLGRPEYWQVNETILSIYYNKLYSEFGRSIFANKEKALEMASKFNSFDNNEDGIENFGDVLSYDDYIKLEMLNRIVILPCKIGEKYYVLEPDCTKCKYKNNGYKGCGYIPKKGESPYSCTYDNELDICHVFDQSNGNNIYIEPERYGVEEIYLSMYGFIQYDTHRKSPYGVWTDRNKLIDMLKKIINKSCV